MLSVISAILVLCCCLSTFPVANTDAFFYFEHPYTRLEELLRIHKTQVKNSLKAQLQKALLRQMPLEHIQDIINQGAPLNKPLYNKITPLSYAVEKSSLAIVKLLIRNGARVNNSRDSIDPLMRAVHYGYASEASLLLENGARIRTAHIKQALKRKHFTIAILIRKYTCLRKQLETAKL